VHTSHTLAAHSGAANSLPIRNQKLPGMRSLYRKGFSSEESESRVQAYMGGLEQEKSDLGRDTCNLFWEGRPPKGPLWLLAEIVDYRTGVIVTVVEESLADKLVMRAITIKQVSFLCDISFSIRPLIFPRE